MANNDVATDVVGSTVTTTATSGLLSNDTDLDGDKLTVTGISDAVHGAGSVGSPLAGAYGHLTLNANGSYSYVADNSSAINSALTGSHLQDVFTYTTSDGNGGTAAATLAITLDRPPVVTAANVALGAGQASVAAASLFTASDPDGNAITTYAFMDTGTGHFVLNEVVQANNQEIDLTAAQLSQLTYQSVPGSSVDMLQVRVNDGTLWSNWTSFTVTAPLLVIQTDGSTSLVEVGNDYFLNNTTSGTGPELAYAGAPFTAGAYGGWTAIGAIQVAGGYDVALKNVGAGQYTVWSTDSSGNYLSSIITPVPASNTALQSIETLFNQDLNGDGHIGLYAAPGTTLQINSPLSGTSGSATIGAGATLELAAADSASVTFSSSTGMLKLDTPSSFSGMIFNFAGNGSLSGSDQIDLKGVNFNSVHDTYANGVLTITDGTNTDTLDFNGSYALANFKFANDGSGGTIVYDPPVPTSNPSAPTSSTVPTPVAALTNPSSHDAPIGGATSDTFVFASNFGQNTIHNFDPNHDTVQIDHRVFSDVAALISHTSDNSAGNAVIVADGHDTITIMGVTTNVLQHHLHDFIIT